MLSGEAMACDMGTLSKRKSEESIRESALANCSLGTPLNDVLRELTAKGYKPASERKGFVRQEIGKAPMVVGTSSIKVELGDYWVFPFLTKSTTVFWGFDAEDRLVDVWAWKTTLGP